MDLHLAEIWEISIRDQWRDRFDGVEFIHGESSLLLAFFLILLSITPLDTLLFRVLCIVKGIIGTAYHEIAPSDILAKPHSNLSPPHTEMVPAPRV